MPEVDKHVGQRRSTAGHMRPHANHRQCSRMPPMLQAPSPAGTLPRPHTWVAALNSETPMPLARPRSSCMTRSTKNISGGKWLMPIFLIGESGSKGSTLRV